MPPHRALLLPLLLPWKGSAELTGTEGYPWFKRGGGYIGHGAVAFDVPKNFSAESAAWAWDNPEDELFRHAPVIDGKHNVYVATSRGRIRKFSPDGRLLWSFNASKEEGVMVTSPFLYDGRLFISSLRSEAEPGQGSLGKRQHNFLYSFDLESGKLLYKVVMHEIFQQGFVNGDSSTVHVAEGVILLAATAPGVKPDPNSEGNNWIIARNASDGSPLWNFTIEGVVWNFMPSTPGDGSFLFASAATVAQRRSLKDGSLIWKSELEDMAVGVSTGGGTLGPNGVFYAEGSYHSGLVGEIDGPGGKTPYPGVAQCRGFFGCPEGPGLLMAHRVSDGKVLWARRLDHPFAGMQYPTVATIDGRLTVIATKGRNPNLPEYRWFGGEVWIPERIRYYVARWQVHSWLLRRLLLIEIKRNAIEAIDAETGSTIWTFEEQTWDFSGAKGDELPFPQRVDEFMADGQREPICGPDNWGIPAVTKDGTVLVGSGSTGFMYAIKDENGDGQIHENEVFKHEFESAFLNNPALAPGMMAVTPCWGKMHVFRS